MRSEVQDGAFTYGARVTDGVSDLVKKSGDTTVAWLPWNPTLKKEYVLAVDQDAGYVYYAAQVGDKNVDDVEIAMMRVQKSKF